MLDTRSIVARLKHLESLAIIPRVTSTNLIARQIVTECIENELSLPQAMIIAGEQIAGRGRNERKWSSPAGKGIYATTMLTRTPSQLALMPLEVANILASYLRETFAIDARIKWPNDILVPSATGAPRKIAGILIEARVQDDRAFLMIGTGINVEAVPDDDRPNATSIAETTGRDFRGIDEATVAFIEHLDARLGVPLDEARVVDEWRTSTIHKNGDRIHCVLGDKTFDGTWEGIDDKGRALVRSGAQTTAVSAGDIILVA